MTRSQFALIGGLCILSAGLLAGCGGQLSATSTPAIATPNVPPAISAAKFQRPILKARGVGVQIYTCRADAGGSKSYGWVLKAPDASLLDEHGATIGRHYEGPTWELNDGSRVVGMTQASQPAPSGDAIPWLLLAVVRNGGTGALASARAVQRVETVGGNVPPSGCDAGTRDSEVRVKYEATYYFYVDNA